MSGSGSEYDFSCASPSMLALEDEEVLLTIEGEELLTIEDGDVLTLEEEASLEQEDGTSDLIVNGSNLLDQIYLLRYLTVRTLALRRWRLSSKRCIVFPI